MLKSKILASVITMGLLVGVMTQPARADFGITIGVGVAMGVIGYLVGHHILNHDPATDPTTALKYKRGNMGVDAQSKCAQDYRSYDTSTGLITLSNGQRKICPYLQ